jgi:Y_Y_Y domain
MLKIKFILICLLAFLSGARAQNGNYFLSHYSPSSEKINYLSFQIAQDEKGVLYFANKTGVVEFDGRNWSVASTPGAVFTIATRGGEVFIGGVNGIGRLRWNDNNQRAYESLSDQHPEAVNIFASRVGKDKVFLLNDSHLFIVNISSGAIEVILKVTATQKSFTGLFEIAGNIYVETEGTTLLKVDQNKFVAPSFTLPTSRDVLFTSTLTNSNKALIGDETGRLFLTYGESAVREIQLKDKSYLLNNVMVSGTWVNESLIAIGTLHGGVFFFNPETGNTEEITNYYTGLPDNEVFALHTDSNLGVWVAHNYGFTRIAPFIPFRSFDHYPGLFGNLLCARSFQGQVHVGTTLGLFQLTKEEIYRDEVVFEVQQDETVNSDEPSAKSKQVKGRIFSLLKKKKGKASEVPRESMPVPTQKKGKPKLLQQKTRRALIALNHVYKKIEGIEGKVFQMEQAEGRLIAGGLGGVYEIEGLKASGIIKEPVRAIFLSPALNQLVVATISEEIRTFASTEKGWNETHRLDTISDFISHMFEDKLQNLWLCGRDKIHKIETIDNEITDIVDVPFSNPSMDETVGIAYGTEVYIAASGVFNRYDGRQNKLVRYDSLPSPKKYFASAGNFWFYDEHRWRTVDPRLQAALKLEWLSLFPDIRFLAPAEKGEGLWVITATNELYKFSSNNIPVENKDYPLFLREVSGEQTKLSPAKAIRVSQLESSLNFEFIQPEYVSLQALEYRYQVKGLTQNWSGWSSGNNKVNFSYLPPGDYQLGIQSKNLMGKISEIEFIKLEVTPPYWKQPWFYAGEFIFFSVLVFLSIKLGAANARYRYLSSLLSLLTFILLIQFIQTIVASLITLKSSPVIDFFIQVSIALLILPIESYLRKFMLRAAGKNLNEG